MVADGEMEDFSRASPLGATVNDVFKSLADGVKDTKKPGAPGNQWEGMVVYSLSAQVKECSGSSIASPNSIVR